jgi:hypothetical protein
MPGEGKMNCEKSRDLMPDWIGQEIDAGELKELKNHLHACTTCRQELAQLSGLRGSLLSAWPDEPIPRPIRFEFDRPSPANPWWRFQRWPLYLKSSLTVTACFLVCLAGLSFSRTKIQLNQGDFSITFGEGTAEKAPASKVISADQFQSLLKKAVADLDQRQNLRWQELFQTREEAESRREVELRGLSSKLRYLETTQTLVWKETLLNKSYVESLARDLYLRTSQARSSQP